MLLLEELRAHQAVDVCRLQLEGYAPHARSAPPTVAAHSLSYTRRSRYHRLVTQCPYCRATASPRGWGSGAEVARLWSQFWEVLPGAGYRALSVTRGVARP